MASNSARILGSLVSLEAWHAPLNTNEGSDLLVDLVFKEGRFGGEKDDKVKFRVRLTGAELVVKSNTNPNLKVPKSSVSRDGAAIQGETTYEKSAASQATGNLKGIAKVNKSGVNLDLSAEGEAGFAKSDNTNTKLTMQHGATLIEHSTDEDKNHCWRFSSSTGSVIAGKVWNEPKRLLQLQQATVTKETDTVSVIMRCAKENIEILDLEYIGAEKGWHRLPPSQKRKEKLAIELLKDELLRQGLGNPDLENSFAEVIIADVIAEVE